MLVKNISLELNENHIKELFECCGPIARLNMTSGPFSKECEIEFQQVAHTKAAVFLSNTPLGDRNLTVMIKPQPVAPAPIPAPQAYAPHMAGADDIPSAGAPENALMSGPLRQAAEKKMKEIACTIYVGNIDVSIEEDQLKKFFIGCGVVTCLKLAGDVIGKPSRFGFVEFASPEMADRAIQLNGAILADRPLKIGPSKNSILKPSNQAKEKAAPEKNVDDIMAKVLAATSKISQKVAPQRSRSRSRSRGRRRRRSRSRSRDRDRSRRRRSSRSRSRDRDRRRRSSRSSRDDRGGDRGGESAMQGGMRADAEKPKKKGQPDRTGMFFDGYSWNPIADLEAPQNAEREVPITAQAAYISAKGRLPNGGIFNPNVGNR